MTTLPPNYIGEFLKENEANLLKIERENPELYKVVGELLTYLDKNYGDGKTAKEEAVENVKEVEKEIETIENQPTKLIAIDYIEIVWNEGSPDISGKYFSWSSVLDALKKVHEDWIENGSLGYNKVKIKVRFVDGMVLLERIDLGDPNNGEFDPKIKSLGQYLLEDGYVDESLKNVYAFEDFSGNQQVVQEAVKDAKYELQAEINELEEMLKFVEDEKGKQEITEEIEALKISLNSL